MIEKLPSRGVPFDIVRRLRELAGSDRMGADDRAVLLDAAARLSRDLLAGSTGREVISDEWGLSSRPDGLVIRDAHGEVWELYGACAGWPAWRSSSSPSFGVNGQWFTRGGRFPLLVIFDPECCESGG